MEPSPLIKAHDHARAASTATRTASPADTTVAVNEHTHAAGEFASAARATSSVEALRMLKLLEDHHKKLATLLNMPSPSTTQTAEEDGVDEKATTEKDAEKGDRKKDMGKDKAVQKAGLSQQGRRLPAQREMSSSIASNLASARGIKSRRSQPLSPSVSNDQAPGNIDAHPRRDNSQTKMQSLVDHSGKPSWVPPMPTSPESKRDSKRRVPPSPSAAQTKAPAVDDGGYGKFYNAFGGIINRISAPLAFAGLPLIQEESTTASLTEQALSSEATSSKRKSAQTVPSHDHPDLSQIYSKASMRAISQDGHPSESFYVVPTSGHTISYANILSYAEKEKRRLGASHHSGMDEDDDFVDARESPVPLSPGAQRKVGRSRTERDLSNTVEELYTENKSLKDMLDKLTKRLHTFEASAQNMAESYRPMRPGSPLATTTPHRAPDIPQEDTAAMRGQIERLEKDNKKMQKTLEKYREKWEALKAGAKARRDAQGGGDSIEDASTA